MHKKMPATTWLAWVHVFNYFTCLLDRGASIPSKNPMTATIINTFILACLYMILHINNVIKAQSNAIPSNIHNQLNS